MDTIEGIQTPDLLESRASQVVGRLKEKPIIGDTLAMLRKELPKNLRYHGVVEGEKPHAEDVVDDAILFAVKDGIEDEHFLELLGITATFHDAGFIDQYPANEKFGAQRAAQAAREAGYAEEDIKMVVESIEDTQVDMIDGVLKQRVARNQLGKYLLDADVGNLGRTDFRHKSDLLFEEVQGQSPDRVIDKDKFLQTAYNFIKSHQWQTLAAFNLRQAQQELNVQALKEELTVVSVTV